VVSLPLCIVLTQQFFSTLYVNDREFDTMGPIERLGHLPNLDLHDFIALDRFRVKDKLRFHGGYNIPTNDLMSIGEISNLECGVWGSPDFWAPRHCPQNCDNQMQIQPWHFQRTVLQRLLVQRTSLLQAHEP
jgi:hypothetical protein